MKTRSPGYLARLAACGSAAVLLASAAAVGQAAPDISVTINGQPVHFADIGPQQINGRTLVPVRGVLEKLGAAISYNSATQKVTASTPTTDIQLTIGSRTAIVNAQPVTLDVPAQTIRDHTFVPLRFIGEALGADLKWDAASRTVVIITRDAGPIAAAPPVTPPAGLPDRDRDRDRGPAPDRDRDRGREPVRVGSAPAPVINSFAVRGGAWLRAGDTLEATLTGTPGGDASFRMPGLAEDIPMREVRPGRYVGSWRVPSDRPMQLKAAAAIGSLKVGDREAPLLQAAGTISVNAIPPRAHDMAPEDGSNVTDPRPNISAALEDRGSGIDPAATRLVVNGRDVTDQATVTRNFISYNPHAPLSPGMQEVVLKVTDMAGNQTDTRWRFTEQPRATGGIRSVRDNFDRALQPGDVLRVTMEASPGGTATFTAGNIRDIPMREDQPGHYVGEYTIRRGDESADQPVHYRFITADGQRYHQASARNLRIAAGRPQPPRITDPGPNDPPTNPLIVRGMTAPFGRVAVRVEYSKRVLGLIGLHGTAADTVVTADRDGRWATDPIDVRGLLGNRGIEYTVTATALNSSDERSDATVAHFRAP